MLTGLIGKSVEKNGQGRGVGKVGPEQLKEGKPPHIQLFLLASELLLPLYEWETKTVSDQDEKRTQPSNTSTFLNHTF